jgi:lipocalin
VKNINIFQLKYVGGWYEIQRFPLKGEDGLNCNQAHYTLLNATSVKVNNTGYDP